MLDVKRFDSVDAIQVDPASTYVVLITEEFIDEIDAITAKLDGEVLGAVVPYLIAGKEIVEKGVAVLPLTAGRDHAFTTSMETSPAEMKRALGSTENYRSLVLFLDGLSPHMDRYIGALNDNVGKIGVLGTGVGYKDLTPRPVIFDRDGFHRDWALMLGTDVRMQVGAKHGWRTIHGPLVVTRAENNVLYELNNKPAFEVYREVLADLEGVAIDQQHFFDVAKSYPFGISSFLGGEIVIRDPIMAGDDGSLTIVSSVKEMDSLYIMKGEEAELIDSSSSLSRETFAYATGTSAILFDCISRVLFLGEAFSKEVEGVFDGSGNPDLKIFGVTSIGEITNIGYEEVKVLNKTTLLGVVEGA